MLPDDISRRAAALLGCSVMRAERVSGSGNNEIFRLTTASGTFALKRYITTPSEDRDRLGHEYGALTFLAGAGESAVPLPVAFDKAAQIAVYEWIAGEPIARPEPTDVHSALSFLARLHSYVPHAEARALPAAVEACVDEPSLRGQIGRRLRALLDVAPREASLAAFLAQDVLPAWERMRPLARCEAVPRSRQTLSPADFGTHNMLRRADGRLAFLDFEYFGWDDPVKLVADVFWHPGSVLNSSERERFVAATHGIYGSDPDYAPRLARLTPLFGLRWALIVLSEFIPERWQRRRRARRSGNWASVKRRQLAKAHDLIASSNALCARAADRIAPSVR